VRQQSLIYRLEDSLGNGFIREEASVTRAAHIILEDNLNSTGNFSVLLEDGNQLLKEGSDTVDITTTTDFGGTILLERTTLDGFVGQTSDTVGGFFIQDDGGKVLIDRVREVDLNGKLLLDGINSDGLGENEQLATENAGRSIILDGTDADGTDGASKLLFEDETGDG